MITNHGEDAIDNYRRKLANSAAACVKFHAVKSRTAGVRPTGVIPDMSQIQLHANAALNPMADAASESRHPTASEVAARWFVAAERACDFRKNRSTCSTPARI